MCRTFSPSVILTVIFTEIWTRYLQLESEKHELRTGILQEFEAWVKTQVMINEMALKESQAVYEADQDERAKEAAIRYESRLDAYQFLFREIRQLSGGQRISRPARRTLGERNY